LFIAAFFLMSAEVYVPKGLGIITLIFDKVKTGKVHYNTLYSYDVVANMKINSSLKYESTIQN